MSADPWKVSDLGDGQYRFTNVTGSRAVMVTVQTTSNERVGEATSPVGDGESFDLKMRPGVEAYIAWTTPPAMSDHTWKFTS